MKRLLTALTITAALLAIALPAQASSSQRYHLGRVASATERAQFGCDSTSNVGQAAFLLRHHGRYTIARKGTVVHQRRIVDVCMWSHPHAVKVTPDPLPAPDPCPMGAECSTEPTP